MWGGRRRVKLSCVTVIVGSLGRSCDVSCWAGGWLLVSHHHHHHHHHHQACFNYQQLASMTNDAHAYLDVDRWPRRLQCLWSSLVVYSVKWSLHCIGSVTLHPTTQWLHQNSPSHRMWEQWRPFKWQAHHPAIRQRPAGAGKYYVGASALSVLLAGCKYCQASGEDHAKKRQHRLQTSARFSFNLQVKK